MEKDNVSRVKKAVREPLEKDIELSQISAWTGESVMNINKGGKGQSGALYKGGKLTKAQLVSMPDREAVIKELMQTKADLNIY